MTEEQLYIRLGRLPWGGRSWNARRGDREAGVSCFRAERLGKGHCLVETPDRALAFILVLYVKQNRPVFELEGEEIGRGGSGEPLLANVKARRIPAPIRLEAAEPGPHLRYAMDHFAEIHEWLYGGPHTRHHSGPQQVTMLGNRAVSAAPNKKKPGSKRKKQAKARKSKTRKKNAK